MSERTASDLAADVRKGLFAAPRTDLHERAPVPGSAVGDAHLALDALVAQVDTLTREIDRRGSRLDEMNRNGAEAVAWAKREKARAEAAEAALAEARQALEQIANPDGVVVAGDMSFRRIPPQSIARRVLAGDTEGAV